MILKAILKIDPNAQVSVNAEDLNQITWHDGNPNNITTAQIEAKMAELPTAEEEAAQIETDKSSGKQKLKDLGLTDAEIKALTGA
mgnify:CR=1 FL=1|jgi:hypothetical protein|tara:strand:+ start:766 stop:1020 length:255 start_codon:yes stop_codon:yes gene_type:complete